MRNVILDVQVASTVSSLLAGDRILLDDGTEAVVQQVSDSFSESVKTSVMQDIRPRIYFDWVLAENTYDILKSTRVLSKICTVAKFNNAEDKRFDDLEVPPAIPIRISTLRGMNDFSELTPYFESYSKVIRKDKESAEEWRTINKDAKPIILGEGEVLPNSRILRTIPYVPGMDVFGSDALKLERASDYVAEEGADKIVGKFIHTEDGDGVCEGLTPKGHIKVRTLVGKLVSYNPLSCFVINKKVTNVQEIRKEYTKLIGLKSAGDLFKEDQLVPPAAPNLFEDNPDAPSKKKKPVPNDEMEDNDAINLYALSINDIFALGVDSEDPDVSAEQLKEYGFKVVPPYYYTPITTSKQMQSIIKVLEEDPKYEVSTHTLGRMHAFYAALKGGNKTALYTHPAVSQSDVKNFYRIKFKPLANPKELRVYPVVSNGKLFLCVDPISSAAAKKFVVQSIPGVVKFTKTTGELFSFFSNKASLVATVKKMIASAPVKIENLKDLKAQLQTIKQGGKAIED